MYALFSVFRADLRRVILAFDDGEDSGVCLRVSVGFVFVCACGFLGIKLLTLSPHRDLVLALIPIRNACFSPRSSPPPPAIVHPS